MNIKTMIFYQWYSWPIFSFAFQAMRLILIYSYNRPRGVVVVGMPTILGKWFTAILYLFKGPCITMDAHAKAAGKPFAIPSLRSYQVCISDPTQITELSNAPGQQLSLNEVIDETAFPRHTMLGFRFDPSDPYNKTTVRALKSGLRSNLAAVKSRLEKQLEIAFQCETRGKKDSDDWNRISALSFSYRLVGTLNCFVILGERLSSDSTNVEAALRYTRDASKTAELLRVFTPWMFQNVVAYVMMRWSGAYQKLEKCVSRVVEERLHNRHDCVCTDEEPLDCIQWVIDASSKHCRPTVTEVAQRTLGFLFGAANQLPMLVTFAIYNLCKHPEYWQPLRDEMSGMAESDVYGSEAGSTPLLDSFLKETARLFPLMTISTKRKVLSDFTFANGTCIPAGNWIGVSQQAMMLDPDNYKNPLTFDGFRFATNTGGISLSTSRFSRPSTLFPFWGSVSRACPARFYVSMIAKMILRYLLTNYDVKLADENVEPSFSWGQNIIPRPNLTLLIRERAERTI